QRLSPTHRLALEIAWWLGLGPLPRDPLGPVHFVAVLSCHSRSAQGDGVYSLEASGDLPPVPGIIASAMNLAVPLVIVLAAGGLAAVALVLVRVVVRDSLLADSGRGRPMVQVTGTLFAVVLAFVILAAFQTYNNAKAGAQSEATAVLDMARTAALFPV